MRALIAPATVSHAEDAGNHVARSAQANPCLWRAPIKVTKKHEQITVGKPSLGIWTRLGSAGSLPRCVIRQPI
jgi:hypothetical protein